MGSVSGTGTASRDRFSENNWQNSTENANQSTNSAQQGQSRAVFDSPEAQQILSYLSQQSQQGGGFQQQAGGAYGALAGMKGQTNPEVENIIKTGNQEANTNFANRAAMSRAGGYRGGTGANLYNQDKVASEFTNKQAGENAALRYGAFNDAQGRQLGANVAGAGGLSSLSGQSQGSAAQLLALLRGQDTEGASQSQTISDIIKALTGGSSGTKSNTGQSISASYQYA